MRKKNMIRKEGINMLKAIHLTANHVWAVMNEHADIIGIGPKNQRFFESKLARVLASCGLKLDRNNKVTAMAQVTK